MHVRVLGGGGESARRLLGDVEIRVFDGTACALWCLRARSNQNLHKKTIYQFCYVPVSTYDEMNEEVHVDK